MLFRGFLTPIIRRLKPFFAHSQKSLPTLSLGILALIVLWPATVNANPPPIRYAHPDQFVLSSLKNKSGMNSNPLLRVVEELTKSAELDLENVSYPAARMFHLLDNGVFNFSILVHSPSLDRCCLIGPSPVVTTELRIYHKKKMPKIASVEALRGKRVIAIRGYSYGQLKPFLDDPSNNIAVSRTITHTSAFAMLEQGRADYVLDYKQPSIEALQLRPIEGIQFETLHEISLHLVLHKSYPNAPQVLAKFERIIETMDMERILDLPSDSILVD